MTDRYRGYTPTGRSATFNPARASLPTLYASDMASTRRPVTTPRGYVTTTTTGSNVPSTTRTYAVTQDPRSLRPTTRDVTRSQRSCTLDSATGRPRVVVITTQRDRPNAASSHTSNARSGSPIRDDYRSSEGQFYTQPASSIRCRSTARADSEQPDGDDYARL